MSQTSFWIKNAAGQVHHQIYPRLQHSHGMKFDVAVIGAGIVGCTAAYLLQAAGKRVALIEGRTIGSGVTSYSTAKLSSQQGPIYSMITQKHDLATARLYYEMNQEGLETIENLIQQLQLNCHFDRRAHTTWTSMESQGPIIRTEFDICQRLSIPCLLRSREELLQELPHRVHPQLGIEFPNQAQFNPYLYCTELCKRMMAPPGDCTASDTASSSCVVEGVPGDGILDSAGIHVVGKQQCDIFEGSMVTNISLGPSPHEIQLENNDASVIADQIVLATHLPILDRSMHFAMFEPSRTHCIAVKVRDKKLHNMFINIDTPSRSMRTDNEDEIVVIAGESMKQGQESDTNKYYMHLEEWAREHFDVVDFVARWSAMDYFSGDHIPFMGYLMRNSQSLFTATAFSKWGLANGIAGARLITDLITGKENRFAEMVDARRWDLSAQFTAIVQESAHTATHLVGDKLKNIFKVGSYKALHPNEGGIFHNGFEKIGVFKDEHGNYHAVKPICTHLGCDLIFNQGDQAWDCPCHGSRFDVEGNVLHGPACKPLKNCNEDLNW
jgi:glycine/D-amino acid oxidase-like deaminating enzyme/nitrite reductase/ring-hydroxylating ferredoxin subunit